MKLTATADSASVIDGRDVRLRKGEQLEASGKLAQRLVALGLAKEAGAQPARKRKEPQDD